MNMFILGASLVANGFSDLSYTAIPFADRERACTAIKEIRRGFEICRNEYPKECVRFFLRSLGLERKGYPTSHWARVNSVLNRP